MENNKIKLTDKFNIYKNNPQKLMFHLFFLGALIIIYHSCIFGENTFLFINPDINADTYNNYYSIYTFIVNMIKENGFSFFSYSIGFGTNVFSVIAYLFDPFSIVPIFTGITFGTEYIANSFIYMHLLKIIAAAIIAFYYLSILKFSKSSCYIGAFIYSLSGFIISVGQHYAFGTIPVLLIFLLYAYERALKYDKGYWLISISVVLILITSIYFAYMVGIFFLIYILIRPIFVLENCNNAIYFKRLVPFVISGIIGILLSAVVVFPTAFTIVGLSGRVSSDSSLFSSIISSFSFSSVKDIFLYYGKFLSDNIWGSPNNFFLPSNHFEYPHYFMSVLFVLLLPQFIFITIKRKLPTLKKLLLFVVVLLVIFATTNTFFPFLFNVFVGPIYRWTYILCPLFILLIAYTLDEIVKNKNMSKTLNISMFALVNLFCIGVFHFFSANVSTFVILNILVSTGIIALILNYLGSNSNKKSIKYKAAIPVLVIAVLVNISTDAYIVMNQNRVYTTQDDLDNLIFNEDHTTLLDETKDLEGDNFYRLDHTLDLNLPIGTYSPILNYRSISLYNSYLNGNTKTYVNNFAFAETTAFPAHLLSYQFPKSYGQQYNFVLADNLGLKYIIADEKIDMANWQEISASDNKTLYMNTNINTVGLLYENYLTEEDFYALPLDERMLIMGEAVILNKDIATSSKVDSVEDKVVTELISSDNLYLYNISDISEDHETQSISAKANENAYFEVYFDENQINQKNVQSIIEFDLEFSTASNINILFDTGSGYATYKNLTGLNNNNDQNSFNLPQNAKSMIVQISSCNFVLSNLTLQQNEINYTNEGVNFENPNYTSTVVGTVESASPSILYLPIPYEEGISVTLNGSEVPILQANFGFLAIEIPSGTHTVEVNFYPPWLNYGLILSLIGIIGFIIMLIYYKKREKR